MNKKETREEIITAADQLFYERGFEHTSFADIAEVVNISRGNFYYHFKTKDEILDAVITRRLADRQLMLDLWESGAMSPRDRIVSFIRILVVNKDKIKKYGCPIGTLFTELTKLNHGSQKGAKELFTLFRVWLRRQLELMSVTGDPDELAMYLLAQSQGIATVASAFPKEEFLHREVERLIAWLDSYADPNGRKKMTG